MKRVLLIANFNETAKNINEALLPCFQVQLCSVNAQAIRSMIKMYNPDLILISLMAFDEADGGIFSTIQSCNQETPVITVGSELEYSRLKRFTKLSDFKNLIRPINNQTIIQEMCRLLKIVNIEDEVERERLADARKHILFVDDDAVLLRRMKRLVQGKHRVSIASSGAQAMTLIGKDKPHLIFLDYDMPVCDGKMVLEMIRSEENLKNIPVVFLTGKAEKKYVDAVLALNPAGYLLKPPSQNAIMELVNEILG